MATMLGRFPLSLVRNGIGLRQPLGAAMFGGLAVSQALTLFTPGGLFYLDRFRIGFEGPPRSGRNRSAARRSPVPSRGALRPGLCT